MATATIQHSIWIDAPVKRVWRAITDGNQIERWYTPGTPWLLSDFEVGGRLYVEDPATGAPLYTQIIEVLEPPYRLVQRSADEPASRAHYTLAEDAGGTRLTLVCAGDDVGAGTTGGFLLALGNLKAVIENAPTYWH